jgi:hypothetical protein
MKKMVALLIVWTLATALGLQAKSFPAPAKPAAGIQLAILLDTSGSMDGLIDQARSRIWKIVNELATARKNGRAPRLQVALYEYGQSSIPAAQGYLRRIVPLSGDLDRVSEELFKLRTNGGDEYCGQVIRAAASGLDWSTGSGDLKMIVIAGNEPFTQGMVDYRGSCREAIRRGIIVNTIFCGNYQEGLRTGWKDGADLADGQYTAIDADNAPPPVSAPQDAEIARLGRELNETYIAYGRAGASSKKRQEEQDDLAAAVGGMVMAERAAAKAAPHYNNSSWDLVDARKLGQLELETMKDEDLPREMKGMSLKERHEYVAAMQAKRDALQEKIAALNAERERFVKDRMKDQAATGSLDEAILRSLREQAKAKGFRFAE